jgi:hypothetical protein
MKNTFKFRSHLTTGEENLAQPAPFLPGEHTSARLIPAVFQPEMKHLPVFGTFLTFTMAKNMMAQPLLKGGLQ